MDNKKKFIEKMVGFIFERISEKIEQKDFFSWAVCLNILKGFKYFPFTHDIRLYDNQKFS